MHSILARESTDSMGGRWSKRRVRGRSWRPGNDSFYSIHHGVWSSLSPVTSLRLAVPHRLGDIESDRLHKLIHPHKETALMNFWGLDLSSTDEAMFQEKMLLIPISFSICSPQARQHQQSYIDWSPHGLFWLQLLTSLFYCYNTGSQTIMGRLSRCHSEFIILFSACSRKWVIKWISGSPSDWTKSVVGVPDSENPIPAFVAALLLLRSFSCEKLWHINWHFYRLSQVIASDFDSLCCVLYSLIPLHRKSLPHLREPPEIIIANHSSKLMRNIWMKSPERL